MIPKIVGQIRQKIIECSICGKKLTITIYPDRTYKGGNCFRPIGSKRVKDESWECHSCWRKPFVTIQARYNRLI